MAPPAAQFLAIAVAQTAGVAGQQVIAVGEQGLEGGHVHLGPQGRQLEPGRHLLYPGQAQDFHGPDIGPADVEFVPLVGKLGRIGKGVVIVVQLLAPHQDAPGDEIGAGIGAIEIAIAPVMAQTVNDPGGPEGNPHHLDGPQGQAQGPEAEHVQGQGEEDAPQGMGGIDVTFQPVIRGALAVAGQGFRVAGLGPVQLRPFREHLPQTPGLGAVGIFRGVAFGMVLAVNGHPFLGHHARGEPQPEPEKVGGQGPQFQGAVGLVAVEKNGDGGNGDVGQSQGYQEEAPPGEVDQARVHGSGSPWVEGGRAKGRPPAVAERALERGVCPDFPPLWASPR